MGRPPLSSEFRRVALGHCASGFGRQNYHVCPWRTTYSVRPPGLGALGGTPVDGAGIHLGGAVPARNRVGARVERVGAPKFVLAGLPDRRERGALSSCRPAIGLDRPSGLDDR